MLPLPPAAVAALGDAEVAIVGIGEPGGADAAAAAVPAARGAVEPIFVLVLACALMLTIDGLDRSIAGFLADKDRAAFELVGFDGRDELPGGGVVGFAALANSRW